MLNKTDYLVYNNHRLTYRTGKDMLSLGCYESAKAVYEEIIFWRI